MSDEPEQKMGEEEKRTFVQITEFYMRALDQLAPGEHGQMKMLILAIPVDGRRDGLPQKSEIQLMSNIDERDIPKVLELLAALVKHAPPEAIQRTVAGGGAYNKQELN